MSSLRILFVGGSDEVGLNATLYLDGSDGVLVDFGALLGEDYGAGIQRVVPSTEPLTRHDRTLHGVVLTHGHEDHIGALPYLLSRLAVPVYGTPMSLALVRARLQRSGVGPADLRVLRPGEVRRVGPLDVELVRVTHSIPQASMVVLRSSGSTVLHTGDFKLDPEPRGPRTDVDRLVHLGREGVDLLLSDSTNAERPGRTATETSVVATLLEEIDRAPGRVVVTFVASHLERLAALVEAAGHRGRRVLLLGASFERNWGVAADLQLVDEEAPALVGPEAAARLPPEQLLIIATGSQGEFGGALARLARGEGPVTLEPEDTVLFSSRMIPGQEVPIRMMINQLAHRGVDVITPRRRPGLHSSGHAQQEEQAELIRWVRPRFFAPVHGDRTMLQTHARTAEAAGVAKDRIVMASDGDMLEVAEGHVRRVEREEVPRIPIGRSDEPVSWSAVRQRRRLSRSGLAAVALTVDDQGQLIAAPKIRLRGADWEEGDDQRLSALIAKGLAQAAPISTDGMRQQVTATVRGAVRGGPEVEVLITTIGIEPGAN